MLKPAVRSQINQSHKPIPAAVCGFKGHLAMITPTDPLTAPAAVRDGIWVPAKNYTFGQFGTLQYFMSASCGQYHFSPNVK